MIYLYVEAVLKEKKSRKNNLTIDYKKIYDMISTPMDKWILKYIQCCIDIIELISYGRKKWKVDLYSSDTAFKKVDMKRGIFEEDSLSSWIYNVSCIINLKIQIIGLETVKEKLTSWFIWLIWSLLLRIKWR